MTDDEKRYWAQWLPCTAWALAGEFDKLPPTVLTDVGNIVYELEQYRKDRDAEERGAWDAYAAAVDVPRGLSAFDREVYAKRAADKADALLDERRKRFSRPEGKR